MRQRTAVGTLEGAVPRRPTDAGNRDLEGIDDTVQRASTSGRSTPWALAFLQPGRPRAVAVLVVVLLAVGAIGPQFAGESDEGDDVGGPAAPDRPGADPEQVAEEPADLPADTTMVWSGAHLAEGYAEAVADDPRTGPTTVVRGEILGLVRTESAEGEVVHDPPNDWWYPVEVLALDPATYDEVAGRELVAGLDEDGALLSETSAEVRGLGPGALLVFADGSELRVADVVPDELVGAAEVAVRADGPLDVPTEKYLLVRPGDPDTLHEALVEHGGPDREPRLVPHGTTPVLRHAHSVLPAVERKARFGEFTMQDRPGRQIRPGSTWTRGHVVTESVPVIGRVTCHRELIERLRPAMQELRDRGAEGVISDYAGCWVPRTSGATGPLSSHAWGMAIDFNAQVNPYGAEPRQPDVLIEVMADHGFLWGGDWHTPDGMHFELAPGRDTSRPE